MARGYNRLPLAAALLAAASSANAGISIPAGDWTLDIGGIVNAYYTSTRATGTATAGYATLNTGANDTGTRSASNITTGLLPNYLTVSGTTRQNDLDVAFTISIQPGASTKTAGIQSLNNGNGARQENRQAFMTFGDKSWGSIKLGKDLGIFASDAILNDMTLLGVGSGAGGLARNTTTLGRIGTGFMYADWKAQVAYTTPNFNGFQATVAVTQAWDALNVVANSATSTGRGGNQPAFEGKASYSWTGDVAGKVWVSGITQKVDGLTNGVAAHAGTSSFVTAVPNTVTTANDRAQAGDIGANVNFSGLSLTGYYYQGSGIGQTVQLNGGFDVTGKARDSEGGYVQATYVLPTATKIGASWGESVLKSNGAGDTLGGDLTDEMWTIGAYHPLTKHLNLVAEYSDVKSTLAAAEAKARTVSFGGILFF